MIFVCIGRKHLLCEEIKYTDMVNTTTLSSQQLIVTVEDTSIVNDLKNAIKIMRGVSKISVKKPKKTELELARENAKSGRVTIYNNKEELFKALGL